VLVEVLVDGCARVMEKEGVGAAAPVGMDVTEDLR